MLLTTRVRSPLVLADLTPYRDALHAALAHIPSGCTFVWLSSAAGYDASQNQDVHEELRAILPVALSAHGFHTSLLYLYDGVELPIRRSRGVACRAVAHVPSYRENVDRLNDQLGRPCERYFRDIGHAVTWLAHL